ncbi:MAG TPA: beta-galactosidase [Streptosporangiaceae bacterium]|nr:beta-galactosidase [Streptosporangiaceae bacterium]
MSQDISSPDTSRVLFGAAYYAEYQLTDRLDADLDLMAAAGMSVIRVGESVWSTWEPSDGEFHLDWLQPVADGAKQRGISVILGTPTYAVPPWLARRYPEIAAERQTGVPIPWGARQEVDYTHPAFRFHAERVIRAILDRYAGHPAVIGVQVDNEPGLELFRNRGVFERFVDTLRARYGDVRRLNDAWGLTYWSHRLSAWADLWRPDGNTFPQYDLAWRRFQADLTTEFIGWQAGIAREYLTGRQFVTTCVAYSRPAVQDDRLTAALDVTAANLYYGMQDGLARAEGPAAATAAGPAQGWAATGVPSLYFLADRAFSSRQAPFLVTETGATSIGGSAMNYPPYDGQLRQAAWALVSRGARAVEYWHWHTLHYGAETYWGGVLPHSLRPGRIYREAARIGSELARAGDLLTDLEPDADVAMVYSLPSKWAMQFAPPLADASGSPDRGSYERIVRSFYDGALDAGLQVRILHDSQLPALGPGDLARRFPVLYVPGLYVADDDLLDLLAGYAEAGGHLVLGIRTGYGDTEARARPEAAPARLTGTAGIGYEEYSNLAGELPVTGTAGGPLRVPAGARGTGWADGLELAGAEALASYAHPHFGRWPAVTTHRCGAGRATYVGTLPNRPLAAALAAWAEPVSPAGREWGSGRWAETPSTVTCTRATNPSGQALRFVHNWSWDEVSLPVPGPVRDVLADDRLAAGDRLTLGPWDVKVLAEEGGDPRR